MTARAEQADKAQTTLAAIFKISEGKAQLALSTVLLHRLRRQTQLRTSYSRAFSFGRFRSCWTRKVRRCRRIECKYVYNKAQAGRHSFDTANTTDIMPRTSEPQVRLQNCAGETQSIARHRHHCQDLLGGLLSGEA